MITKIESDYSGEIRAKFDLLLQIRKIESSYQKQPLS